MSTVFGVLLLPAAEIPDLSYSANEVGTIIGRIDEGNGLLPADGDFTLGAVQMMFHKGYMIAPAARNAANRGTGDRRGVMAVFDISDPRNPERVFFRQDEETNETREQHGNLLFHLDGVDYFVANSIKGVMIWDVTNPAQPTLVSNWQSPILLTRAPAPINRPVGGLVGLIRRCILGRPVLGLLSLILLTHRSHRK